MQVDLAKDPGRRYEMVQAGQCETVPQLHAKGRVRLLSVKAWLCMLSGCTTDPAHRMQFVGTLETVQELEDFGELDVRLW